MADTRSRKRAEPRADTAALRRIETLVKSQGDDLSAHRRESNLWRGEASAQLTELKGSVGGLRNDVSDLQVSVGFLDGVHKEAEARKTAIEAAKAAGRSVMPNGKRGWRWWLAVGAAVMGVLGAGRGAVLFVEDFCKALVHVIQQHPG